MLTLYDQNVQRNGSSMRLTVVATQRHDGNVHPTLVDPFTLLQRQETTTGRRWAMLDQIHGTTTVDLDRVAPEGSVAMGRPMCAVGDVSHTDTPGRCLAIWAADCAEVVLVTANGRLVVAHAGWRGLAAGVLDAVLDAAGRGGVLAAILGPVIHPCCYEFGEREMRKVERGVHARSGTIAGTTDAGTLALDIPAAVRAGLAVRNITLDVVGPCTGCDPTWFSHRVRGDTGRHATVAWIGPAGQSGLEN